ncbi:MAG: asparagine synthase (glutamine-hydrolyzing) [Planctomycetaceae bacterium]|nr:asparagine synthase (glutamine-hydrolyzing) [Planctomycetaceae bacterium]MBV8318124.1 asparagine synthase (glutamine-hydrolyzing) [Planctomycetaceae bacterium]
MCGIAGFFGSPQWELSPRLLLRRMIAAIQHRGPDEWGMHVDGRIGLGHARLSIIDLSSGQQPMADETETVWVTFNGEIFNYVELRDDLISSGYRFRTTSDTEVILHAYQRKGPDCIEDFNGDFAFALWDKGHDRLVLARDRMGVRPVFYTVKDGVLIFGSEVKALLQVPGLRAEIDPVALSQCFTFWYPLAPRTVFKGIQELPPGHVLTAERGTVSVRAYWQPRYPAANDPGPAPRPEEDLAEELHALLIDATRIRLRADVPVGAYLSGGLDSSAVTALIKRLAPGRLRTFSVGFEAAEFDESRYQLEVARALRCDHEFINIKNSDISKSFNDVIRHAERPIIRTAPAPLYQLARLVRRNSFKVVLTGEGADEIFGGYDLFKEAKVRRFWARQPHSTRRPLLLRRLYPYLAGLQGQSQAYLGAFFKVGLDRPEDPLFSHLPRWATTSGILRFLSDDLLGSLSGYDPIEDLRDGLPPEFRTWHPLSRAQYLETVHLLPGYILSSQGDRVAMAHAVEGRFPFLDHRVVEFAAGLPPRMKLRGLTEKYLLRRSVGRDLPPVIAERPKQPYRAPDGQCFFGEDAPDYVEGLLSPGAIADAGYFDPRSVEKLVRKYRGGGAVGFRDNMALVGILSVQLLDHHFVRGAMAGSPVAGLRPLQVHRYTGEREEQRDAC